MNHLGTSKRSSQRYLVGLGAAFIFSLVAEAKAGPNAINVVATPVGNEDADIFCKKEEFSTSCE